MKTVTTWHDLSRDTQIHWQNSTQWHTGQVTWLPKGDAYRMRDRNKILWFRKQITAFWQSYVQHSISKLLQPEKPTFPFPQNEWHMVYLMFLFPPGNVLSPRAQWKEACLVISLERDHWLCQLWCLLPFCSETRKIMEKKFRSETKTMS